MADRTSGTGGNDQLGENYLRSVDLELDPTERGKEKKKRKTRGKKKTDVGLGWDKKEIGERDGEGGRVGRRCASANEE